MSVIDVVLIGIGCWFVIKGLLVGFTGEVMSLISVIGGFYCSARFSVHFSEIFSSAFGISPFAARAAAMVAIFLGIFIVCMIIKRILRRILKEIRLTALDKIFGALAGFIKIYVISLAVLLASMIIAPISDDAWVRDSKVLVATAKTWPHVSPVLDSLGLLPDLAEIQERARDHIANTASRALFPTSDPEPEAESETEPEPEDPGIIDRAISIFR